VLYPNNTSDRLKHSIS